MATLLKNTGKTPARVFGPTGAVIVVEPSKTVEVSYQTSELSVETGGAISISEKKTNSQNGNTAQKEGE